MRHERVKSLPPKKKRRPVLEVALGVVAVVVMANLDSLVGMGLHPELPYFDQEHLIVGGISALVTALLVVLFAAYTGSRRANEEALAEKDKFLTNVFDSIQDGISILDKDFTIVRTNPTMEKVFARKLPLQGRKCYEAYHDRAEPCEPCPSRETLRSGGPQTKVFSFRENGEDVWLEFFSYPFYDCSRERIIGVVEFIRNVTAQKRLEVARRESELNYRHLFYAVNDGILTIDLEGRVLEVNDVFFKRLGYRRDEILKMTPKDFDAPEYALKVIERIEEVRRNGSAIFETAHVTSEGNVIPIEMSATLIEYKGKPAILAIARDITERKRAEERLKESELKFRTLFETTPDDIALVGLDGMMLLCNRQAALMHGYERPEEMIGRQFLDFVAPEEQQRALIDLQVLAKAGMIRGEYLFLKKDGSRFSVEVSATLMTDAQGNPKAMLGVVRDITERKSAEREIRQLNEELELKVEERTKQLLEAQDELVRREKLATLGRIAGCVGHELRNPLGVMNNAVYFLQMTLTDADDITKEYLDIIKGEILGAERIVGDLLDAVRTRPPQPQTVPAEDLVRMSLEKCMVPADVRVEVDIEKNLAVRVDPLQMKQAFLNLINNAAEAMPDGGLLEIKAEDCGQFARFTFRDEGAGISPENMKKLFQPLFTTKARGIGLGLVVVKNLAEANGGRISVLSEVGKGTAAVVEAPAGEVSA